MKDKRFMDKYYYQNILETKRRIKASVNEDNFINQCISNIDEIDKAANLLSRRLREWYELYNPEFSNRTIDHKQLAIAIARNQDIKPKGSMGANLRAEDISPIVELAKKINELHKLRASEDKYLDEIFKRYARNLYYVAGSQIGARLIAHAGSLKKLSMITASTIQILGAEKALFRHMKTGARAPKHGLILQHKILQAAKPKDRGKVARALADKISMAARIDFFKGKFIGDKLRKELDARFA